MPLVNFNDGYVHTANMDSSSKVEAELMLRMQQFSLTYLAF